MHHATRDTSIYEGKDYVWKSPNTADSLWCWGTVVIDFHCALRDILQDTSAQVYGVKVATDIHSLLGRLIYLDCPSTGLNAFAESQANTFAKLKNQPE